MNEDNWTLVIVEDERETAEYIATMAAEAKLDAVLCGSTETATAEITRLAKSRRLAAIVADLRLPGINIPEFGGWEAISLAYKLLPGCPIAVYSANYALFAEIVAASTGQELPPFTVYSKPDDDLRLRDWIIEIGARCRGARASIVFDPALSDIYDRLAPIFAPSHLPVLIVGQSGTGKETLAREIHDRSKYIGPFVPINCAALDEGVVLAELFGSERGSWTDAHAHKLGLILQASGYKGDPTRSQDTDSFVEWLEQSAPDQLWQPGDPLGEPDLYSLRDPASARGTLFLDEVTCLPQKAMGGLLRALSTQDVRPYGLFGPGFRAHCRIIAATNDAQALREAHDGPAADFRRDLFYRLGGVVLNLPSVRHATVIAEFARNQLMWESLGLPVMGFGSMALQRIFDLYSEQGEIDLAYQQGNFRTLRNLLHRAGLIVKHEGGNEIRKEHIEAAINLGVVKATSPLGRPRSDKIIAEGSVSTLLRNEFLKGLQAHGVSLESWYSLADLQRLCITSPLEVADAFLRCCLCKRQDTQDGKTYYSLHEVEEALTSGASRRAWLSKGLTPGMVSAAAIKFYDIPAQSRPGPQSPIRDVVNQLRHLQGKRRRAVAKSQ